MTRMKFIVTGKHKNLDAEVRWEDGRLTFARPSTLMDDAEALAGSGAEVVFAGVDAGPATLSDERPYLAAATVLEVMDEGELVGEDFPEEKLPEGAIA